MSAITKNVLPRAVLFDTDKCKIDFDLKSVTKIIYQM